MRDPIPHLVVPFIAFHLFSLAFASDPHSPATLKVGVILDMKSPVGSMSRTCINMALSDFYSSNPNSSTRLLLFYRHSPHDVITAASSAVGLLINEHVHAIVGPQSSAEAAFVADIGDVAHTPILSFSATSPGLFRSDPGYFLRTAPSDTTQAQPIAAIVSAFGWRRVVLIYEDDDFGTPLVPYLVDALNSVNTRVAHRMAIPTTASDESILAELYESKTMATRVFVVHVTSALAPRLFSRARDAGMMSEGYAWIVTAGLTSLLGSLDPSIVHDSMQGVIGVKPYIPTSNPNFREFKKRWRGEFLRENPTWGAGLPELSDFGVWAYDTVWALAMAAGEAGPRDQWSDQTNATNSSTDMSEIVVSKSGKKLLDLVSRTEFNGLGGKFRLVDGERNVTAFEVVNVNVDRGRGIGFWTPKYGLTRKLNWSSTSPYLASMEGVGPVIWPGESTVVPEGWVDPTSGKKLKVVVPWPVDPGFQSFIRRDLDPATNQTVFSGFVIEVFEAAVRQLPYALPFEYHAVSMDDYNGLVQLVFLEFSRRTDSNTGDDGGTPTTTGLRHRLSLLTLVTTGGRTRRTVVTVIQNDRRRTDGRTRLSAAMTRGERCSVDGRRRSKMTIDFSVDGDLRHPPSLIWAPIEGYPRHQKWTNQEFDAVVGDVTITWNRSKYVDFTLPYTASGVSMVVPLNNGESKNAWIFLKPLTAELWIMSGAFFIFTGAVVWVLEHRINTDFSGPPAHQLGAVFYFAFATLVYAHREKIVSNLTKVVVIVWLFVVLILQSSYIASLTSRLTVQQLQPSLTEFSELIDKGYNVGYLEYSFVHGLLIEKGFDPLKLRPYTSPQQYEEALTNGSVAAVIDEISYLNVFLKDRCDNFTMAAQTYKTGGFGFVFPKGSPLVPDLSRAILNVTEADKMNQIERAWLGNNDNCADQNTISPSRLDFASFFGLFLITGTASLLSLLICLASFLFANRHHVMRNTSSILRRLGSIARRFDEKDLSSHTFKQDDRRADDCVSPVSISMNPMYEEEGAFSVDMIPSPSPEMASQPVEMITLSAS